MPQLWIVHRQDRERAALVRLAGASGAAVGRPGDPHFDQAAPADVVVMGLAGDWEAELEFAHRQRARLPAARWVLVGDRADAEAARELFDRLSLDFLPYPPHPDALRRLAGPARAARRPALSERARRESVAARFSLWLGGLERPVLLRALDPRLAGVSLLVRGERGSGRETAIRYVHEFGGTAEGWLAHVACDPDTSVEEIARELGALGRTRPGLSSVAVWLDEPARLRARTQRELAVWLKAGAPPAARTPTLRWLASVDETGPDLDPDLSRALGTLELRLPPLRERVDEIETIASGTARAWARAHGERPRSFAPDALAVLREYPWPGNLRELEAVVEQSLASTARDPLGPDDLELDGTALAPLDAAEVGTLLRDDETEEEAPAPALAAEGMTAESVTVESETSEGGPGPWLPAPLAPALRPAAERAPPAAPDDAGLRRLAATLSQQVRNPLATIRSFAELLPERFDDPDFRARFAEMVREDVSRIDGLLSRLEALASLDAPQRAKVNVSELLQELLEERREAFRSKHLLVLKELDSRDPIVLADRGQLRLAFGALLDKTLEIVPVRGDVYLASRRRDAHDAEDPAVRVLLRFHDPSAGANDGLVPLASSLELLVAELGVRAQGGTFTLGASESEERVIVVDLPAV